MKVLMTTAYWPNLHYFYYVLRADPVIIEWHDAYQKQSYRNRTMILSANGPLALTIPLSHTRNKQEMLICNRESWRKNHFRAIESAYNNSPYYEYFRDEISSFYEGPPPDSLREFNERQLICILGLLRLNKNAVRSESYENNSSCTDLRDVIHPKKTISENDPAHNVLLRPYYQTFSDKFGFTPNLSVLDLLFNTGLGAKDHLRELTS